MNESSAPETADSDWSVEGSLAKYNKEVSFDWGMTELQGDAGVVV